MDPFLRTLIFSTYLGGAWVDCCYGMVLDLRGRPTLVGDTGSPDFPTTPGAWDRKVRTTGPQEGRLDGFVARFDSMGRRLLYSTLLGGKKGDDRPSSIALDPNGRVVLGGWTAAPDFPTTPGAWNRTAGAKLPPYSYPNWSVVSFLASLRTEKVGVTRVGDGTPSCLGDPALYVQSDPLAGSKAFGLECWKAPPSSFGALLLGVRAFAKGIPVLGVTLWVDPVPSFVALPLVSGKEGKAVVKLPLPQGSRGGIFTAQALWANTASCGGLGTFSASDALEIRIR